MGTINNFVDNVARASVALSEALSNKATNFTVLNDTLYPSVLAVKTYTDALAALAGSASQVFSVGTPTAAAHAMRADQIATKNLVINGGMQVNQAPTAALSGTLQFGSVDMMVGALAGSAASGTLTQATNATISPATTKCLHLSGISFTSGYVSAGTRIKASRTAELNGKTISVRVRVYHDFGVDCPVTFVLNKANSADVFSAVTNKIGRAHV